MVWGLGRRLTLDNAAAIQPGDDEREDRGTAFMALRALRGELWRPKRWLGSKMATAHDLDHKMRAFFTFRSSAHAASALEPVQHDDHAGAGVAVALPAALSLIIRNRWPSADTS